MVLAMSRPWKHPKTGIYWLRKGVPDDLRAAVGKREEKFSLKTRDPVEAKRLHAQALIEIEQRWSNLRAPISSHFDHDVRALPGIKGAAKRRLGHRNR
jgi:hypothetical protein